MDDQLSFLPDLDRASDEIKQDLCNVWNNEKLNEIGICTRCGFQMLKEYMKNGLCAACYALLNPPKKENEDGWKICPICNEKVGALCKSGLCVECDYKSEHPEAQKIICEDCVHFRFHQLYDENDHTECCCKLHLEGKNRHEWTYLCKDFVKVDSVQDFDRKYEGLMKYASQKSEEIARWFIAEGWKEVPDKEKESAMHEQNGWIEERNMDAFEPRKGTRFFLIDIKSLTWKCYFKRACDRIAKEIK